MGKTYRTAQGRSLDLEQLKLQNELTPAVGNMRVNARGDQLGPGGKVVKSREEMLDQHYQTNVSKRRKGAEPDVIPTRAGKVDEVEPKKKFKPDSIRVDPAPASVEPEILEDDFVDPEPVTKAPAYEFTGDTEESVKSEPKPEKDPVTGFAKGEKALKGGLARAVAKTREYEDSKNKPKRI
jgi:hypothetical protein